MICMGKEAVGRGEGQAVSKDSGLGERGHMRGLNAHFRIWLEALLY